MKKHTWTFIILFSIGIAFGYVIFCLKGPVPSLQVKNLQVTEKAKPPDRILYLEKELDVSAIIGIVPIVSTSCNDDHGVIFQEAQFTRHMAVATGKTMTSNAEILQNVKVKTCFFRELSPDQPAGYTPAKGCVLYIDSGRGEEDQKIALFYCGAGELRACACVSLSDVVFALTGDFYGVSGTLVDFLKEQVNGYSLGYVDDFRKVFEDTIR